MRGAVSAASAANHAVHLPPSEDQRTSVESPQRSRQSKARSTFNPTLEKLEKLPLDVDREKDEILQKLCSNDDWQPRRFIVTQQTIYLSRLLEDAVSDMIPLVMCLIYMLFPPQLSSPEIQGLFRSMK